MSIYIYDSCNLTVHTLNLGAERVGGFNAAGLINHKVTGLKNTNPAILEPLFDIVLPCLANPFNQSLAFLRVP